MNPKIYLFPTLVSYTDPFVKLEDYQALKKETEALKAYLREDVEAASIFQPEGKYHKEANLQIGGSCVVCGIAWMDKRIDELKENNLELLKLAEDLNAENKELLAENADLCESFDLLVDEKQKLKREIEGWKNKLADSGKVAGYWKERNDALFDRLVAAEKKLDKISETL